MCRGKGGGGPDCGRPGPPARYPNPPAGCLAQTPTTCPTFLRSRLLPGTCGPWPGPAFWSRAPLPGTGASRARAHRPGRRASGTHSRARARVPAARACSRAPGASVSRRGRAHTRKLPATRVYSSSPAITHKQSSHSPTRLQVPRRGRVNAGALNFPTPEPRARRAQGIAAGETWRAAPPLSGEAGLGPPLSSRR